jgi:ParB family transcriptional regulator, chromosome partitioning protein
MNDIVPIVPETPAAFSSASKLQNVPIDLIRPSPHQARKIFDEENLWKLAESMRQEGLIQPITVRKLLPTAGDRNDPGYELVSGERRLRAAKLLNWTEIEARVISVISEGEVAAKGLIENLQREDLNPLEEAEGFSQLNQVDPTYWTHERVAQVTGKSRVYITQSLSLLRLPEAIKEDVRRRTYSRAHALEIARLPGSTMQLSVAKMIPGRLTREQTRKLIDSILLGKKSLKMNKPGVVSTAALTAKDEEDPMADFWPEFVMNPWIGPPGTIQVHYLGNWKWSFELPGPQIDAQRTPASEVKATLRSWLSQLLTRMGRSLSYDAGNSPETGG